MRGGQKDFRQMGEGVYDFLMQQRQLLKIALMEAMQSSHKTDALFRHMDRSFRLAVEKVRAHGGTVTDEKGLFTKAFFSVMMPLALFAVMGDAWCRYQGIGRQEARVHLIHLFAELYPQVSKSHIER